MLLRLLQCQPGESCGEIWRAIWEGGKFGGTVWGPGKGNGDFGVHLHAAQLRILLAK